MRTLIDFLVYLWRVFTGAADFWAPDERPPIAVRIDDDNP